MSGRTELADDSGDEAVLLSINNRNPCSILNDETSLSGSGGRRSKGLRRSPGGEAELCDGVGIRDSDGLTVSVSVRPEGELVVADDRSAVGHGDDSLVPGPSTSVAASTHPAASLDRAEHEVVHLGDGLGESSREAKEVDVVAVVLSFGAASDVGVGVDVLEEGARSRREDGAGG